MIIAGEPDGDDYLWPMRKALQRSRREFFDNASTEPAMIIAGESR